MRYWTKVTMMEVNASLDITFSVTDILLLRYDDDRNTRTIFLLFDAAAYRYNDGNIIYTIITVDVSLQHLPCIHFIHRVSHHSKRKIIQDVASVTERNL